MKTIAFTMSDVILYNIHFRPMIYEKIECIYCIFPPNFPFFAGHTEKCIITQINGVIFKYGDNPIEILTTLSRDLNMITAHIFNVGQQIETRCLKKTNGAFGINLRSTQDTYNNKHNFTFISSQFASSQDIERIISVNDILVHYLSHDQIVDIFIKEQSVILQIEKIIIDEKTKCDFTN